MSDYLTPDQIRDMYAETIARARFGNGLHVAIDDPELYEAAVRLAMQDVDALAAAGLLPIVTVRYQTDGKESTAYRTELRDVPPPPPAPGKGRGPR